MVQQKEKIEECRFCLWCEYSKCYKFDAKITDNKPVQINCYTPMIFEAGIQMKYFA
jgi:hypothetical protein